MVICHSCADDKPTVDDLKNRLDLQILLESSGDLSLSKITQTNAYEHEIFGQLAYTIEFVAKVKANKKCYLFVNPSGIGQPYYFQGFKTISSPDVMTPSPFVQILTCEKGDVLDYDGHKTYKKTENGWK